MMPLLGVVQFQTSMNEFKSKINWILAFHSQSPAWLLSTQTMQTDVETVEVTDPSLYSPYTINFKFE